MAPRSNYYKTYCSMRIKKRKKLSTKAGQAAARSPAVCSTQKCEADGVVPVTLSGRRLMLRLAFILVGK